MKKRTFTLAVLIIAVVMTAVFCLCACDSEADNRETYIQKAEAFTDEAGNPLFANSEAEKYPQTMVYEIATAHLNAPLADGKTAKKVLFLGYDGCRVDVLQYAVQSKKEAYVEADSHWNDYKKDIIRARKSGLMKLRSTGALVFAYSGGEKGGKTQQATSTAPSWASMLTGKWAAEEGGHGVLDNGMYKPSSVKTFLTEAAEAEGKNYSASFTTSWREHQAVTYQRDIEYAIVNNLDVTYTHCPDDAGTFYDVLARVSNPDSNQDTDVVFCTLEGTDHAGHNTQFGIQHFQYVEGFTEEDDYAYRILQAIENRPTYDTEDWCIIFATDHGGYKYSHGGQTIMERTTWICTNQPQYLK